MTPQPNWSTVGSDDPVDVGPSDAEIEAWAVRERQRREQWLSGPTPEQAAVWAARERERRLGGLEGGRHKRWPGLAPSLVLQRSVRNAQLAAEGSMSLLFRLSLKNALNRLVQAGRDWEEEFTR